jgi:hypothetical protein
VLAIPVPGKEGSGLHPSGKELPEQRSITKIPLAATVFNRQQERSC